MGMHRARTGSGVTGARATRSEEARASNFLDSYIFTPQHFCRVFVRMSGSEARALELIAKGDKKLNSLFASLFGNKYEDAEELYSKAANQLKVAKNCVHFTLPLFICGSLYV